MRQIQLRTTAIRVLSSRLSSPNTSPAFLSRSAKQSSRRPMTINTSSERLAPHKLSCVQTGMMAV